MKKVLAIALALVLVVSLAACMGNKKTATYEGDLSKVIDSMYEYTQPEFMLGETVTVDLTDAWSVSNNLGLELAAENATDGDAAALGIKEAYVSEPMMSSQAYSLVIARVSDAEKTEEIKKAMFENINPRKWICVEADQIRTVSYGDVIMLVMVSSDLSTDLADNLVKAFAAVVSETSVTDGDILGKLTGELYSKG